MSKTNKVGVLSSARITVGMQGISPEQRTYRRPWHYGNMIFFNPFYLFANSNTGSNGTETMYSQLRLQSIKRWSKNGKGRKIPPQDDISVLCCQNGETGYCAAKISHN